MREINLRAIAGRWCGVDGAVWLGQVDRNNARVRRRLNIVAPEEWVQRVDDWRRHQADLPNLSEAIRRLVDLGLASGRKGKRGK